MEAPQSWLAPIAALRARPVHRTGLAERLRLTAVSAALTAAGIAALVLAVLIVAAIPAVLSLTGFLEWQDRNARTGFHGCGPQDVE